MVVLMIVAGGFRKSFGASPVNPFWQLLPFIAMAVLLAALIAPANRLLLHAGALAALALTAFCLWQLIAESATITWVGIAYLLVWLFFYWRAAWQKM